MHKKSFYLKWRLVILKMIFSRIEFDICMQSLQNFVCTVVRNSMTWCSVSVVLSGELYLLIETEKD